jgi:hypothetical protein
MTRYLEHSGASVGAKGLVERLGRQRGKVIGIARGELLARGRG